MTDSSDSEVVSSLSQSSTRRSRVWRTVLKLRWPILYFATVAILVWWYEFRSARLALREIQGAWQKVEGVFPNERPRDSYWQLSDNDTWLVYPSKEKWEVQRSRITMSSADNFFVVRRAWGFDYGTTRETEYILHVRNNEVFIIHGLARLDPVREHKIERLRRVESLPDDAWGSIQEYLRRISAKSSNKDGK